MNRISEDVTKVRMYLGPGIMYSINLIALSILVIKNMININSLLTLIVLIPLPIMLLGIFAGSVQALIFSTLAAAYIAEALE